MANPTTRPHQTRRSRPRSRCTPPRCGGTGWWPRHCPPRPASPAPAAPPPCAAGSLLGRREPRGSCQGPGYTEISLCHRALSEAGWECWDNTDGDSQDRLGGRWNGKQIPSVPLHRVTPLLYIPQQTWITPIPALPSPKVLGKHKTQQGACEGGQTRRDHKG